MGDRHEPWCDSQLGPEYEVRDGELVMTITACMGCKGEPIPTTPADLPPDVARSRVPGGDGEVGL